MTARCGHCTIVGDLLFHHGKSRQKRARTNGSGLLRHRAERDTLFFVFLHYDLVDWLFCGVPGTVIAQAVQALPGQRPVRQPVVLTTADAFFRLSLDNSRASLCVCRWWWTAHSALGRSYTPCANSINSSFSSSAPSTPFTLLILKSTS